MRSAAIITQKELIALLSFALEHKYGIKLSEDLPPEWTPNTQTLLLYYDTPTRANIPHTQTSPQSPAKSAARLGAEDAVPMPVGGVQARFHIAAASSSPASAPHTHPTSAPRPRRRVPVQAISPEDNSGPLPTGLDPSQVVVKGRDKLEDAVERQINAGRQMWLDQYNTHHNPLSMINNEVDRMTRDHESRTQRRLLLGTDPDALQQIAQPDPETSDYDRAPLHPPPVHTAGVNGAGAQAWSPDALDWGGPS